MLRESNLLAELQQFSFDGNGQPLCLYGDPAYPISAHLLGPFKGQNLNEQQMDFNRAMSALRESVEWGFGKVVNYFKFVDFKKNLKIELSAVGKMYAVAVLLSNAHTCLYGSQAGSFFDLEPPFVGSLLSMINKVNIISTVNYFLVLLYPLWAIFEKVS